MKQLPLDTLKAMEIKCHIIELFNIYGEDMSFLNEYLLSVSENDIDKTLRCFRDLIKQAQRIAKK